MKISGSSKSLKDPERKNRTNLTVARSDPRTYNRHRISSEKKF